MGLRRFFHRPSAPDPRIDLVDVVGDPGLRRWDDLVTLRGLAAEGLTLQFQAERVITDVRRRVMFGQLAKRGGPLVRRFFDLQDQLPRRCEDVELDALRGALRVIFGNHAMQISVALDLLAVEWRSPEIGRQLDALDGLGVAADELRRVEATLQSLD